MTRTILNLKHRQKMYSKKGMFLKKFFEFY